MTKSKAAVILAIFMGISAPAWSADACTDFKWDVSKERALFAGAATELAAGVDAKSAPEILANRLYRLQLVPQDRVQFAAAPGRNAPAAAAYAGLATLKITESGSYRVAIDLGSWIDVAANGSLLAAKDFQGQHDCSAPHKIVEFDFVARQPLILQLSGATADRILLAITPTPARIL